MLDVFKKSAAVEAHVRALLKLAQGAAPPPPQMAGPPPGQPPLGPPPPPWDPMRPPGPPKQPPSANPLPSQQPYTQRAQDQGKTMEINPLAAQQSTDFLGKGSSPRELMLRGHNLAEKPPLVGRVNESVMQAKHASVMMKVALGIRLARQLARSPGKDVLMHGKWLPDPRKGRSQTDSMMLAFAKAPEELSKGYDQVERAKAKRKVKSEIERKTE